MAYEKLLKNLSDNILVNRIKRNYKSNSAVQELKLRHENLYFNLLYKTLNRNLNEKRDLEDDCLYFIYDAAKTFNPHKHTKFSSYLGLLIRWKSQPEKALVKALRLSGAVALAERQAPCGFGRARLREPRLR